MKGIADRDELVSLKVGRNDWFSFTLHVLANSLLGALASQNVAKHVLIKRHRLREL